MEFLPIGDTKLKIVLTAADMRDYKIEVTSGELRSDSGRRGLWHILDRAKDKVGFDPRGDKVLIQFYPMSGGGCEIFVTKLGILPISSANIVSKSERVTMLSRKRNFYCFEALQDLIAVCRQLEQTYGERVPDGDVYHDGANFYLALDEYAGGSEDVDLTFITEFSFCVTYERGIYLAEHGELWVKKDAVKVFSEL